MSTPLSLRNNGGNLVNELGFVDVNKSTLQHVRYSNVFALSDCANSPNSKTAAAVAAQSYVVFKNLSAVMEGRLAYQSYEGYSSCPIVTGYSSCVLTEFDYTMQPMEFFPFDQAKERLSMFLLKRDILPFIYWHLMMNGSWNGPPIFIRNVFKLLKQIVFK